jgi:Rab GDP dissociation inhibitor
MGPPIPIYEPLESGQQDKVFLSKSYDATSHFETTTGKFDSASFSNIIKC